MEIRVTIFVFHSFDSSFTSRYMHPSHYITPYHITPYHITPITSHSAHYITSQPIPPYHITSNWYHKFCRERHSHHYLTETSCWDQLQNKNINIHYGSQNRHGHRLNAMKFTSGFLKQYFQLANLFLKTSYVSWCIFIHNCLSNTLAINMWIATLQN